MVSRSIVTAVGIICVSGVLTLLQGGVHTEVIEFSEDFENGEALYLETLSGNVTVKGVDGNRVEIKAVKNAKGSEDDAKEALEQLKVEFKKSQNRIDVITEFPDEHGFLSHIFGKGHGHRDVWVDFEISIPSRLKVVVDATSAAVDIRNVTGDILLDLTSGDVFGEDLGSETVVDGTSGRVELRKVGGDIVIDNTSGDAIVVGCTGDVEVDKTSGEVSLRDIEGDVEVDGTSCDVNGEDLRGFVTLNLVSGNVVLKEVGEGISFDVISGDIMAKFVGAPSRESQFSSISGDVTLLMEEKGDLDIDLESISGELTVELEGLQVREMSRSSLRAFTGEGQVKVLIETVSGDVEIIGNDI
jgi:hypothetical protein